MSHQLRIRRTSGAFARKLHGAKGTRKCLKRAVNQGVLYYEDEEEMDEFEEDSGPGPRPSKKKTDQTRRNARRRANRQKRKAQEAEGRPLPEAKRGRPRTRPPREKKALSANPKSAKPGCGRGNNGPALRPPTSQAKRFKFATAARELMESNPDVAKLKRKEDKMRLIAERVGVPKKANTL